MADILLSPRHGPPPPLSPQRGGAPVPLARPHVSSLTHAFSLSTLYFSVSLLPPPWQEESVFLNLCVCVCVYVCMCVHVTESLAQRQPPREGEAKRDLAEPCIYAYCNRLSAQRERGTFPFSVCFSSFSSFSFHVSHNVLKNVSSKNIQMRKNDLVNRSHWSQCQMCLRKSKGLTKEKKMLLKKMQKKKPNKKNFLSCSIYIFNGAKVVHISLPWF